MVSDDQIMKTQTCFLQEMVQKERIQPSTVDLVHLVPFCLSLEYGMTVLWYEWEYGMTVLWY